jgi:hypothetical protein
MKPVSVAILHSLCLILLSASAYALGGWSSGGGELLKGSRNPWFLNNVREIKYCIKIDSANFGTSREIAEEQVARAIQFWKSQFSYAVLPNLAQFGQLQIANQNFRKITCTDSPDIAFQFGVLSKIQRKYLVEPKEYAAVSVRTHYDQAQMRGNGFIYISPSHGRLAYNSEGVVKNAWAIDKGALLYFTLLHELGHVFGLPHIGSYGDVMSEGFVEATLAGAVIGDLPDATRLNFFSLPKKSSLVCQTNEINLNRWHTFFGTDSNIKCLQFELEHDPGNQLFGTTIVNIYAAESPTTDRRKLYSVPIMIERFFPTFISLIWLPKTQLLFQKSEVIGPTGSNVLGVNFFTVSKEGQFTLSNGKSNRALSIKFEQGKGIFSIDGVLDGRIVPIL